MRVFGQGRPKVLLSLTPLLMIALLLAVACGAAATPEPTVVEKEVIKEVEKIVEKGVVVEKEVVREVEKIVVATPTPVAMDPNAIKTVDQLTLLTASFGNEVFNSRFISGDKFDWWRPLQETMIAADNTLALTDKGLVTKWELTDDNKGWEYTVRDDATFHNGDPITAEDVAFSIQWSFHPDATSRVRQRIAKIIDQHAVVTGPNTVKTTFTQPLSTFAGYLSEQVASGGANGIVLSESYFDQVGVEGYEDDPNPGSAGPFNLVARLFAEEMVYDRWDDHYRKDRQYAFDRLSIRLVSEQSTQIAALRAGTVDIIPADLTVIDQIRDAGANIQFGPEATVIWINANSCSTEQPPQAGGAGLGLDLKGRTLMCNDRNVRYALDYAIDKELIQQFYGGPEVFEIKGTAAVSPSGLGYGPGLDPFPYDPDKARQLLADAAIPMAPGSTTERPGRSTPGRPEPLRPASWSWWSWSAACGRRS